MWRSTKPASSLSTSSVNMKFNSDHSLNPTTIDKNKLGGFKISCEAELLSPTDSDRLPASIHVANLNHPDPTKYHQTQSARYALPRRPGGFNCLLNCNHHCYYSTSKVDQPFTTHYISIHILLLNTAKKSAIELIFRPLAHPPQPPSS